MLLKLGHCLMDSLLHGGRCPKEVVVEAAAFEIAPEPFDGVQFRAVLGQPDHKDVCLVYGQEIQDLPRRMVRSVIQHQDQEPMTIGFHKLSKELGELRGVLLGMHHVVRLSTGPVEGAIDTPAFIGAGRWNDGANASQCPHFGQGRVEVNLTLVEVQQVEVRFGLDRVFFRKSSKAFFSSYS